MQRTSFKRRIAAASLLSVMIMTQTLACGSQTDDGNSTTAAGEGTTAEVTTAKDMSGEC